jgi:hypothetical protein
MMSIFYPGIVWQSRALLTITLPDDFGEQFSLETLTRKDEIESPAAVAQIQIGGRHT